MTECPWTEIVPFYSAAHFQRFSAWLDSEVRAGIAREVPVDRAFIDGLSFKGLRWFMHVPSGEVWCVAEPDGDGKEKGGFERVNWTPVPNWRRRYRGETTARPFWETGQSWEPERALCMAEFVDLMVWIEEQIRVGRAREYPIPEAVERRSTAPRRWFMDLESGQVWELLGYMLDPLELPPSLAEFYPRRDPA